MKKVLFVCLGNICRSPLAEGIFSYKAELIGRAGDFMVDSCGTSNYHIGEQPDPRTRDNARQNGIELLHAARQFTELDFDEFDMILAMDRSNKMNIERLDRTSVYAEKIWLLRDFDPMAKGADVPDPYYGGERGFQDVFEIVERSIDQLLNEIDSIR